MERIERDESKFDFSVLEEALENAHTQLITELAADIDTETPEVEVVSSVPAGGIVIDIRHPNEAERSPLRLESDATTVMSIPFYNLRTNFKELDAKQHYLLYCDRGMMSRLHAAHLLDEGFANISVLDLR